MPDMTPGVASALSPLVRRIVAPNPGLMTGPGTNTYLVGIDEVAVVDPGPDDAGLSGSTTVITPPDGDMAAYLQSLERLRQRRLARLCPGHGDVLEEPKAILAEYVDHRIERENQILEALADGPGKISDLVA